MTALVARTIGGPLETVPAIAPAVLGETTFSVLVWAAVLSVILVFVYVVRELADEWG